MRVRVRSTGNCAAFHNRDLHLFTLLLRLHSSEASLEGSHSTQSANRLRAASVSAQRGSAALERGREKEGSVRESEGTGGNRQRKSKKAKGRNERMRGADRPFLTSRAYFS